MVLSFKLKVNLEWTIPRCPRI